MTYQPTDIEDVTREIVRKEAALRDAVDSRDAARREIAALNRALSGLKDRRRRAERELAAAKRAKRQPLTVPPRPRPRPIRPVDPNERRPIQ